MDIGYIQVQLTKIEIERLSDFLKLANATRKDNSIKDIIDRLDHLLYLTRPLAKD